MLPMNFFLSEDKMDFICDDSDVLAEGKDYLTVNFHTNIRTRVFQIMIFDAHQIYYLFLANMPGNQPQPNDIREFII